MEGIKGIKKGYTQEENIWFFQMGKVGRGL
jgi:hypothetical protein